MTVEEKGDDYSWSREQDKAFENALATYPEDSEDRWEKIVADVPGKTLEEVKHHYELLVEDVNEIESGRIPLPSYSLLSEGSTGNTCEDGNGKKGQSGNGGSEANQGGKGSKSDQERRKGIAWTEDEHRLFLLGLDKYGKGDWRSISRNFVVTRTPTQVASHAQKYFIRLNSMNKDRRRSSIHDITSVDGGDISAPQGPITGQSQTNPPAISSSSAKSNKLGGVGVGVGGPAQVPPMGPPGGGCAVYGTPVGGGPAVGTPVNLSAPSHLAYGMRAPVAGTVVPGAPIGMAYPMPHTSGHR